MLHPFVNNKTSFSIYAFVWCIIALTQIAALIYFLDTGISYAIFDSIIFNAVFFALGLALWYPTSFIDFEHTSGSRLFMNHATGAFVTSGIWIGISYFLLSRIFAGSEEYIAFLNSSLIWRFLIGILFYIIIVSVNYLTIYYNNFRETLSKESELNALVKEAELKTLKYQINPHFIFNSLNSISSLTISDPDKARDMTIKLSSFMRGTLSRNEKQKNKLEEELENVKLYLDIEKIRFEEKFELVEKLSEECKQIEVPNMILQPLFENAIKHGVYESLDKVTITIECKKEKGYMKISVINNYDKDGAPRKGEGIGIINIKNRLKLIYNQDNLLQVSKSDDIFTANLFIPLEVN